MDNDDTHATNTLERVEIFSFIGEQRKQTTTHHPKHCKHINKLADDCTFDTVYTHFVRPHTAYHPLHIIAKLYELASWKSWAHASHMNAIDDPMEMEMKKESKPIKSGMAKKTITVSMSRHTCRATCNGLHFFCGSFFSLRLLSSLSLSQPFAVAVIVVVIVQQR